MMKASEWFDKVYTGEDTSQWMIPSPEEAAKLVQGVTGRQFRARLHMACCYSYGGPMLSPAVLPEKDEKQTVAMAAWMLSYHDRKEDARELLANGLIDSEGLREAFDLSFRFTAEGGHDA